MQNPSPSESIFIVWSSGDPEVARNIAFMYAKNAYGHGWWQRVRLIIWGPSARLACEDESLRKEILGMLKDGVEVWACRACAENYGLVAELESMGVDVRYMGEPITQMIRDGWRQLTF
ncbi:DsrE family protein [Pseudodesulfovibrio sp.]|uniref:DsrE family protein n=1 Tax=unclassified Pseudodesulfovibrio TaxID=2661612 RepID=UPI003B007564